MRSYVLDSNAINPIVEQSGAFEAVRAAVEAGRARLFGTHILEDELAATKDAAKRANLERVLSLTEDVPTAVFVFDRSRIGRAALGGGEDVERFRQLSGLRGDGRDVNDSLYAVTAYRHGAVLVTADGDLRRNVAALGVGLEVLLPDEFLAEVGYVAPPHT